MSDGAQGAQDWIDDLTEPSGGDGDDGPSLFEENFRQMLNDGDVEDMAVSTLEGQVERIDDPEILSEAIDADGREEAQDVYQSRIGDINGERQNSDDENAENTSDDTDQVGDDGDEAQGGSEGETSGGEGSEDGGSVSAVLNDIDGGDAEGSAEGADDPADDEESEEDPSPSEDEETADDSSGGVVDGADDPSTPDLPDVDVDSLAPDAISREQAAEQDKQHTVLVWGPEGSGKSHIAHSAPEPICYIDTEGKADELAEKFEGKRIHYFEADNYQEAKAAMEQALDVLHEYLDAGFRGTLVVDSMTAMWEYAKVDYAKFAYQTEDLSDVNFQSELEGEKDWTKIKARHNESFRERILETPFHVVFTSGQKEDYNAVFDGGGKAWVPDGEKWNKYAVKDVVRLRRDETGKTVGDLRKAAKTRYSFVGLEWPTFDDIYAAIQQIYDAEQADEEIDLTDWPFEVVDGQPLGDGPEGSDAEDDDGE